MKAKGVAKAAPLSLAGLRAKIIKASKPLAVYLQEHPLPVPEKQDICRFPREWWEGFYHKAT